MEIWDISAGGSALAGETSQEAAARETFEELGYRVDFSSQRPFFTVNFKNGFNDFYLLEADIDIAQLVVPNAEVQAVKWASKEEILQMMAQGELVPYHLGLISIMFSMLQCRGALRA